MERQGGGREWERRENRKGEVGECDGREKEGKKTRGRGGGRLEGEGRRKSVCEIEERTRKER